jgi:hypothetical protein
MIRRPSHSAPSDSAPGRIDGALDFGRPLDAAGEVEAGWSYGPAPASAPAPARVRAPVQDEPRAAAAEEPGPERLYVITGGRGGPSDRTRLDLVTLVVAVGAGGAIGPARRPLGLFPEHTAILRLCRRPLSAAELSAHLRLPFSATAVLIDDLLCAGLVTARPPRQTALLPDPDLIREVLRGLQRL